MSGSAYAAPSSLDLTMAVVSLTSNPCSGRSPFFYPFSGFSFSSLSLSLWDCYFAYIGLGMRDFDMNRLPSEMEQDGPTGSVEDDEEGCAPRKKLRLTKEQSRLLEASFRENQTLNPKQKEALALKLNLRSRQVEVWFQNRRARTKLKQTEMECEYLKRCFGSLTEENRRLQREVEELRALRVAPPTVISPHTCEPLPAATLTMCPCCERVSSSALEKTAPPLSFSKASIFPSRQSAAC